MKESALSSLSSVLESATFEPVRSVWKALGIGIDSCFCLRNKVGLADEGDSGSSSSHGLSADIQEANSFRT
jgi:hypothetical protein